MSETVSQIKRPPQYRGLDLDCKTDTSLSGIFTALKQKMPIYSCGLTFFYLMNIGEHLTDEKLCDRFSYSA